MTDPNTSNDHLEAAESEDVPKKLLTKKNVVLSALVFVLACIVSFLAIDLYLQSKEGIKPLPVSTENIRGSEVEEEKQPPSKPLPPEEEGVIFLGHETEPQFKYNTSEDQWYFITNINICSGSFVYESEPIEVEGELSAIGFSRTYFRDDKNVFFVNRGGGLHDTRDSEYQSYNCDGSYKLSILEGADPNTFETIRLSSSGDGDGAGKDSKSVFIGPNLLVNSDPSSFRLVEGSKWLAVDNNQAYFLYQIPIHNADPSTFSYLGSRYMPGNFIVWSKDANNVFLNECLVEGVDAATVEFSRDSMIDKYGKFTASNREAPKEGVLLPRVKTWDFFPFSFGYEGYKNCVREREEVQPFLPG